MQFTVTRQRQWPEGKLVVEISKGGFDYVNPDMLVVQYPRLGEGETFTGMIPAVAAGIAIAKAWKEAKPKEDIGIAVGFTHGCTLPFDGEELTAEVEAALLAEADRYDAELPKCAHCGDILGDELWGPHWQHPDERDCCSENCAEMHYNQPDEDEEYDEDEDEDEATD